MNLKQAGLLFCGASAVTLGSLTVPSIVTDWQQRQDALALQESVQVETLLSRGTMAMSLERSITQVGLSLPSALPAQFRTLLDDQREKVDEYFAQVRTALAASENLPTAQRLQGEVDRLLGQIADLRADADADLSRTQAERSPTAQTIPAQIKATIEALESSSAIVQPSGIAIPATVALESQLQRLSWEVREYSGRERTHFAIAAATGAPISAADLREMETLNLMVLRAKREIEILAQSEGLSSEIVTAVAELDRGLFGSYQTLRERMLSGADSGAYPVSFDTFFADSS